MDCTYFTHVHTFIHEWNLKNNLQPYIIDKRKETRMFWNCNNSKEVFYVFIGYLKEVELWRQKENSTKKAVSCRLSAWIMWCCCRSKQTLNDRWWLHRWQATLLCVFSSTWPSRWSCSDRSTTSTPKSTSSWTCRLESWSRATASWCRRTAWPSRRSRGEQQMDTGFCTRQPRTFPQLFTMFSLRLAETAELLQTQVDELQQQVEELKLSPPHRRRAAPHSSQSASCLQELQDSLGWVTLCPATLLNVKLKLKLHTSTLSSSDREHFREL